MGWAEASVFARNQQLHDVIDETIEPEQSSGCPAGDVAALADID
jgi:hypothetical protein